MTALPPLDNRNVRAVVTAKYEINKTCSHPECDKPTESAHHIWPRSFINNDSYFVEIGEPGETGTYPGGGMLPLCNKAIPHAVGLCGSGTTGHHGDVEEHRAWIKYEDNEFVWYDRLWKVPRTAASMSDGGHEWVELGPLNPQPGSREAKAKRRKKRGDERRKRRTISIRVPDDAEDGAAIWDETQDDIKARLVRDELYSERDKIPAYEAWIAAARDWLNG